MLRYRTDMIPIREMTFLYVAITVPFMNSLFMATRVSFDELVLLNGGIASSSSPSTGRLLSLLWPRANCLLRKNRPDPQRQSGSTAGRPARATWCGNQAIRLEMLLLFIFTGSGFMLMNLAWYSRQLGSEFNGDVPSSHIQIDSFAHREHQVFFFFFFLKKNFFGEARDRIASASTRTGSRGVSTIDAFCGVPRGARSGTGSRRDRARRADLVPTLAVDPASNAIGRSAH